MIGISGIDLPLPRSFPILNGVFPALRQWGSYVLISRSRGFTLIELLVVVALIAILAAIAMPAYSNYINRGKLRTAQADLVALSLNFENYYRGRLSYPTAAMNQAKLVEDFKGWRPASAAADFTFSSAAGTGADYTLSATAVSGTALAGCMVSLKGDGNRSISGNGCGHAGSWL